MGEALSQGQEGDSPVSRQGILEAVEEFKLDARATDLYDFLLHKKIESRAVVNRAFFKELGVELDDLIRKEVSPQNGYHEGAWETFAPITQGSYLDFLAMRVSARQYGLRLSSWSPRRSFNALRDELEAHGPMCIGGVLGNIAYLGEPFKLRDQIDGRAIYGWKPEQRAELQTGHYVTVVGARTISGKEYVYYVDPQDSSDPDDSESQKIYIISYQSFIEHVCDLHGRMTKDSPPTVGYAYTGNFQLNGGAAAAGAGAVG